MSLPKYFVDGVSKISPDKNTGIVRLTFSGSDGQQPQDEVQIIMHAEALNQAFQKVGEHMSKTFGGGGGGRPPGGRGGPGGPGGGRGGPKLRDLTEK